MNNNKKKHHAHFTRRNLLQNSAIGAFGLGNMGILAEALFHGAFNSAHAQSMGIDKNYIYISQFGAPARWYFDLPLTPDGQKEKFQSCKQVGTRFKEDTSSGPDQGRYTQVVHETSLVNGLHMPWMWRFDIPKAGGGVVPMKDLMEGMLIMRGVNTNNPAHEAAQSLHYRPMGIPVSLTALTADISKSAPIAGVSMNTKNFTFKSGKGLSGIEIQNGGNMVKELLKLFVEQGSSNYKANQAKIQSYLDTGLSALDKYASDQDPKAELIKNNMNSAVELLARDFGDLNIVYTEIYNKYIDLIARATDPKIIYEGINDKPVGTTGARGKMYRFGGDDIVTNSDLREMITDNISMVLLARRFATAEFILVNKLSTSVSFNTDRIGGFGTLGARTTQIVDEHNAGCIPSLIVNTYFNLAISSCLYEFIAVLKENNLYNDSVIDFCGEFGRNPQNDGGGSDHSEHANSNTLFSGAIGGNGHVIGNIEANKGGREGTWGYGAFNSEVGYLNLGHFVSTLSHIIGITSPITAARSLLKLENGKLVPIMPTGTIID